jgi:hypothetical protein
VSFRASTDYLRNIVVGDPLHTIHCSIPLLGVTRSGQIASTTNAHNAPMVIKVISQRAPSAVHSLFQTLIEASCVEAEARPVFDLIVILLIAA